MSDRGCSTDLLRRLYYEENKSQRQLMEMFGIRDYKVIKRWFKESNITPRENGSTYTFNKNYFDNINTEDKAYWIGFIWCDGYVCHRIRNEKQIYEFKLDLAAEDEKHVYKFRDALEGNQEIKEYRFKSNFKNNQNVCRFYTSNTYFSKKLHSDYGLKAGRHSIMSLISKIPDNLLRHFIRGIIDADGSISGGYVNDRGVKRFKARFQITTCEELCDFVNNYLINKDLTNTRMKLSVRHEGGDGYCRTISFCGNNQVEKILSHLYEDSNTYLDRKFEKYIEIKRTLTRIRGLNIDLEAKNSSHSV
ncbi:hypothetical protein D3C87_980380 [compost metagenome]